MQPQMAPPSQPQPKSDPVQDLVVGIAADMEKFRSLLDQEPKVSDEAKAKMDSLIQGYKAVVSEIAEGPEGAPKEPPPQGPPPGPRPVNQGMASDMAGGAKGARPMRY